MSGSGLPGRAPVEAWRIAPYALYLTRPWVDAHGQVRQRRGLLVELRAGNRLGYGECAPLESAGTESLPEAAAALDMLVKRVGGLSADEALAALPAAPGTAPAARCAVETALVDLKAQALGLPMAACLGPTAVSDVAVNGVLGPAGTARAGLPEALADGYRVLKVKVGMEPWEREREALAGLFAALPGHVTVRLDANGAWTVEEAARHLAHMASWAVESLEEPSGAATNQDLQRLQAASRFPLALDESLANRGPGVVPVRRQILKPMVCGGPLAVVERAAAVRAETVVTTTVDAAVGVWAAVHAAAAVSGLAPGAGGLAHGLATGGWLAHDVAPGPVIRDGSIRLPATPGLGVRPTLPP